MNAVVCTSRYGYPFCGPSAARQTFLLSQLSQDGDQAIYPGIPVLATQHDKDLYESIVHLSVLTQLVIKHMSEELSVEDLIYQLEHLPVGVKSVPKQSLSNRSVPKQSVPNQSDITSLPNKDESETAVTSSTTPTQSPSVPIIMSHLVSVPVACLRVTYKGTIQKMFHVNRDPDFEMRLKLGLMEWIQKEIPQDLWLIVHQYVSFI